VPAGKPDGGEPPLGSRIATPGSRVSAGRWQKLGEYFSSPGVLTEVIHVFLARDLTPADAQPEEHEVFEVQWVPVDEAVAMAAGGGLKDGKSIVGLLWAQAALRVEAGLGQQHARPVIS
jgi:ADP-ribose pyrophosphatase